MRKSLNAQLARGELRKKQRRALIARDAGAREQLSSQSNVRNVRPTVPSVTGAKPQLDPETWAAIVSLAAGAALTIMSSLSNQSEKDS